MFVEYYIGVYTILLLNLCFYKHMAKVRNNPIVKGVRIGLAGLLKTSMNLFEHGNEISFLLLQILEAWKKIDYGMMVVDQFYYHPL